MTIENESEVNILSKTKVLIVDDDEDHITVLKQQLERSGFTIEIAFSGEKGLQLIGNFDPDILVLDVSMPGMSGRDVLKSLRRQSNPIPIIMLSQYGDPSERALSIMEGADDYLNKPFLLVELIARIEAILRRSQRGEPAISSFRYLVSRGLILDRQARVLILDGTTFEIAGRAFGVLEFLMLNQGEIISRRQLMQNVWGWTNQLTRVVDNRISELRKRIGDDPSRPEFIESVIDRGYRFLLPVEGRKEIH